MDVFMARWLFWIPIVIIAATPILTAQTDSTAPTGTAPEELYRISREDTGNVTRDTLIAFEPSRNAWLAVGLSALLPGAGQIYNEDYVKLPIIWGLGGYWLYEWFNLNSSYKDFKSAYQTSITPLLPQGDERLRQLRDFYRDERDRFAWFMGGLYFLNLVDAYVGAELYDFDVSPDLGLDGKPTPRVTGTVRIRF